MERHPFRQIKPPPPNRLLFPRRSISHLDEEQGCLQVMVHWVQALPLDTAGGGRAEYLAAAVATEQSELTRGLYGLLEILGSRINHVQCEIRLALGSIEFTLCIAG